MSGDSCQNCKHRGVLHFCNTEQLFNHSDGKMGCKLGFEVGFLITVCYRNSKFLRSCVVFDSQTLNVCVTQLGETQRVNGTGNLVAKLLEILAKSLRGALKCHYIIQLLIL
jgi:hypothetical protein